jgi:Ca2+-binding RTX toxin-like protein
MNTTPRSIAARLILVGTVAASAAAFAPGIAGASGTKGTCQGKVVQATANGQVLHGTNCADTFKLSQFSNVTVYAGDGNDTVSAGFVGNGGTNYLYLEGGNDTVTNSGMRSIWVQGGSGNDTIEGSTGYDAFFGGSGFDTIEATPGDHYVDVEAFFQN